MRISELLLLEYNQQRLINDFGNKLLGRAKTDSSCPKTTDAEQLILKIADLDPTPNKELAFWLVMNYAKGLIARFEDIGSRAVPVLVKFKALLRKPNLAPKLPVRDINQIAGLSKLQDLVDQYQEKEAQSNSQLATSEEQNFFKSGQAELVYDDSQVKVVIPKTLAASCFFGINTRWCTAAKSNNMFAHYSKNGPLYIVLFKKEGARYQFHFESAQFINEKYEEINPNELADKY